MEEYLIPKVSKEADNTGEYLRFSGIFVPAYNSKYNTWFLQNTTLDARVEPKRPAEVVRKECPAKTQFHVATMPVCHAVLYAIAMMRVNTKTEGSEHIDIASLANANELLESIKNNDVLTNTFVQYSGPNRLMEVTSKGTRWYAPRHALPWTTQLKDKVYRSSDESIHHAVCLGHCIDILNISVAQSSGLLSCLNNTHLPALKNILGTEAPNKVEKGYSQGNMPVYLLRPEDGFTGKEVQISFKYSGSELKVNASNDVDNAHTLGVRVPDLSQSPK